MIPLLSLILGLLLGFYGRQIYDKLNALYEQKKEEIEARQVGVVKVQGISATRNQPIDLSSDTGPVQRPRPSVIEEQRQINRDTMLRENHK